MNKFCSTERNVQILIEVLKANNIHKVIASPGATDVSLNVSLQHDSWFEVYSEVDERGAAYLACGMASESNEPVVITCTGATSSRNYMPGLTEAYYRKLPILAVTCCRNNAFVGQLVDQVTDRSNPPHDTVNVSVHAQTIRTSLDEWDVVNKINRAVLGLTYNGGGPCHINLESSYDNTFTVEKIPTTRIVRRYTHLDELPEIPSGKKVGIFVGAHQKWTEELTDKVTSFCRIYDAVVLCDHTSNYKGEYCINFPLLFDQVDSDKGASDFDLIIHIGYISNQQCKFSKVWRINPDGEPVNTFGKLQAVFQMTELEFFRHYTKNKKGINRVFLDCWKERLENAQFVIPELPFSNIFVAQKIAPRLPKDSVVHLGIRNSIRAWNYFDVDSSILCYCNTGGFGIDGGVSSLIGASLCDSNKLYFGVFGDLLFFYNINAIGNRHIKPNLRILIINNGLGQEFLNHSCRNTAQIGGDVNLLVAAEGHFGGKSKTLVRNFAESLGFIYLSASDKVEFDNVYEKFIDPNIGVAPMIFEVFTNTSDESEALKLINTLSYKSKLMQQANEFISKPELNSLSKVVKKIIKPI